MLIKRSYLETENDKCRKEQDRERMLIKRSYLETENDKCRKEQDRERMLIKRSYLESSFCCSKPVTPDNRSSLK